MTDFHDLSKLPDDAAYWHGLEARVLENATPLLCKASSTRPGVWAPLAERAGALGGLAFAAALAALLLVPPRPVSPAAGAPGLLRIPQDDPTMAAFLSSGEPPPVVTLVLPDSRRRP